MADTGTGGRCRPRAGDRRRCSSARTSPGSSRCARDSRRCCRRRAACRTALLLTGAPGAGQAEIAAWLAARLLCRARGDGQPCGECADCRLFLAGSHPDFRWIGVLPDKKDIGIDQMRALSEALSMRSYRGGAKVVGHRAGGSDEREGAQRAAQDARGAGEPRPTSCSRPAASSACRKRSSAAACGCAPPLPPKPRRLAWLRRQGAARTRLGRAPALAGGRAVPGRWSTREGGLGDLECRNAGGHQAAPARAASISSRLPSNAPGMPRGARLAWLESWLTRSLKDAALASDAG